MFDSQQVGKYLAPDDLEPLVNPELEWKLCLGDLKSDNWSRQFDACNTLRKVIKYHQNLIHGKGNDPKVSAETVSDIIASLLKLVESLRSSLSKISLIAVREFYETIPKMLLENHTEKLFDSLLKKSSDSNVFMAEEAEKSLTTLVRQGNE